MEIEFTVVADEDIGGLVESTQMGARNEAVGGEDCYERSGRNRPPVRPAIRPLGAHA